MAWYRCEKPSSGGGGGGASDISIDAETVNVSGIYETDYKNTIYSFTAMNDAVFAMTGDMKTNTGSNDGYVFLDINGINEYKLTIPTGTSSSTPFTFSAVAISAGDFVEIGIGFDNNHTNCNFTGNMIAVYAE